MMTTNTPKTWGTFVGHTVESVPNGRNYGKDGWVPCDHRVRFDYETEVLWFDGQHWTRLVKEEV